MRKGCRTSKTEKACGYYDYGLGRCKLGKMKYTCGLIEQPKPGTKKHDQMLAARRFYGSSF